MLNFRRLHSFCKISKPKYEFVRIAARCFHHEFSKPGTASETNDEAPSVDQESTQPKIPLSLQAKYKEFRDEDAPEIFDVEEEKQRFLLRDEPETLDDLYAGLNLKRGVHGVYDIEDLVDVLRKENAHDIFVCSVPKELKYVDYQVVCSGRSYRHMVAIAEFVRRIYKAKRKKGDILPIIEGEKSRDWMALDLGNIALHIFSPDVREEYDLESLWAIGAEYDKEYNKPQDPLVELFERNSTLFADIKPK